MARQIGALNEDLAIHQKLDDEPNDVGGLSAGELKALFDRAPLIIQKYINEVLVQAINGLDLDVGTLAEQLSDHVDVDVGNLSAANISVLRELADRYGLTDKLAPTVHDALEVLLDTRPLLDLEKYMTCWWARRVSATTYDPVVGELITLNPGTTDNTTAYNNGLLFFHVPFSQETVDVTYADSVVVGIDGALQMVDPQTVTVAHGEVVEKCDCVKGKYVKNVDKGNILYVPEDAVLGEVSHSSFKWQGYAKSVCKVTPPDLSDRPWERIHDSDRGAYPEEGELDGMEYRYLGVPVERLIDMMVEEATTE